MPVDPVFINVQYVNTHVYIVYIELANTQISCVGCLSVSGIIFEDQKNPLIIVRLLYILKLSSKYLLTITGSVHYSGSAYKTKVHL